MENIGTMQSGITAKKLCKKHGITAAHSLYREDGRWYHVLKKFPGVLFDKNGFVLFGSQIEFADCKELRIYSEKDQVVVASGISSIPGYVTFASLSQPESHEAAEHITVSLNPQFAASASVAFTIVGYLLQRVPDSHQLSLRMTFPCQGQGYQCLSLFADYQRRHVCDFNILSGRLHIMDPFEGGSVSAVDKWPNERNYFLAFLANSRDLHSIVDDVLAALGIPKNSSPNLYQPSGCMALAIGSVIGRFLFDTEHVWVENGWANEKVWSDWLESVPEDCMLNRPFLDHQAGRLWRLEFRERSALFDEELVYLTGTEQAFDVCLEMASGDGSISTIATRVEEHLRDSGTPGMELPHR